MTTKKSTKRALLMSALALLMCFSMLIGSTYAWFTDSVTSGNNKIQAGTLKIDLLLKDKDDNWTSIKDTSKAIFDYDNWEPGYTDVKVLQVVNEGTLALKWYAKFVSTVELTELADVIDVYVNTSVTDLPTDREAIASWNRVGTVREFVNTISTTTYGNLEAGKSAYLGIALKMQESAGNKYQGMNLGGAFDIQILATQYTSESDSFNNQYDKDATYVSAGTVEELQDAIAKGEPVTLTDDITMDTGNFTVAAGTEAVINLGGNDLTVTNTDATAAFLKVEGDLTITGEGNVAARQINTYAGSKLTLGEGVTISTSNSFAINNSGTTVLDGATINHTGTNHAIQNQGNGTLIINDATVTSNSTKNINTINSQGGTVIINGGTFVHEGSMGSVIKWLYSNEGEIIINGGTFIQKGGDSLAYIDYGDAKLTINGGTFDSASYFAQPAQNIVINAGEFKNNAVVVFNPFTPWTIADKYVPATSTATANADGSITVTVN